MCRPKRSSEKRTEGGGQQAARPDENSIESESGSKITRPHGLKSSSQSPKSDDDSERRRRYSVTEANDRHHRELQEREQIIDVTPGVNGTHASAPSSPRDGQLLEPYTLEWHAERNRRIAVGMKVKFMDRCAENKTPWVAGLGFPPCARTARQNSVIVA